jgi:hypothetical protein
MKNVIIDGVEYAPVIKQSQIVNKHYHFELHPDNLGEMNWDEAVKAVKKLGEGWRLPNIEECYMIYKDKLIDDKQYWTSEDLDPIYAWYFSFYHKSASYYLNEKEHTYIVRPIRNLKH